MELPAGVASQKDSHDSSSGDSHRDWKRDRLEFQRRLTAGEAPANESHYERRSRRSNRTRKGAIESTGPVTEGLVTKNSTSEAVHRGTDPDLSTIEGPAWSADLKQNRPVLQGQRADSLVTKNSASHPVHSGSDLGPSTIKGPAWAANLKPKMPALQEQRAASDEQSPALFNSWGSEPAPKPGQAQPARMKAPPEPRPSPEEKVDNGLGAWCDDQAADRVNNVRAAMNGDTGDTASAGKPSAGWHEPIAFALPADGLPFDSVHLCSAVLSSHTLLEGCL